MIRLVPLHEEAHTTAGSPEGDYILDIGLIQILRVV